MNVFVLCTGRCGSTTFYEACKHITNFSTGHETRAHLIGTERLQYPAQHIEADNRLAWMLGRLEQAYGDDAVYVHLQRNRLATARSFTERYERKSIIKAYREGILLRYPADSDPLATSLDCCETIDSNIAAFLKGKTRQMQFSLENASVDFPRFWKLIGATGDYSAALAEWSTPHNSAASRARRVLQSRGEPRFPARAFQRLRRIIGLGKAA